mmetsp:Transcript_7159/g.15808  ORF Transcript_7159/g.15808 Transcript_7159/m.15808 type:complete len:334 (+) Transcript_7159:1281-2282(+)
MAEKHLGRRVRQRPRVRLALHSAHQPEIRQFRVACRRDEHVGRLDVAVEELVVMQVAHALEHLRDVEARRLLVEVAATLHHGAQLAARHELRREVDVGARFEGEVAANQKIAVVLLEDRVLDHDGGELVLDARLPNHLHRVNVVGALLCREPDLAVGPDAEAAVQREIADAQGQTPRARQLRGARWVQGDQVLHDHELLGDDGLELGGARVEDSAAACLVQLLQRVRDGDQLGYGEALVLAAVREREEAIRLADEGGERSRDLSVALDRAHEQRAQRLLLRLAQHEHERRHLSHGLLFRLARLRLGDAELGVLHDLALQYAALAQPAEHALLG